MSKDKVEESSGDNFNIILPIIGLFLICLMFYGFFSIIPKPDEDKKEELNNSGYIVFEKNFKRYPVLDNNICKENSDIILTNRFYDKVTSLSEANYAWCRNK